MDKRGALISMVVAALEILSATFRIHFVKNYVTCRTLGKGRSDHMCHHITFLLMSPGNCSEGIHSPWTVQTSDFGKEAALEKLNLPFHGSVCVYIHTYKCIYIEIYAYACLFGDCAPLQDPALKGLGSQTQVWHHDKMLIWPNIYFLSFEQLWTLCEILSERIM